MKKLLLPLLLLVFFGCKKESENVTVWSDAILAGDAQSAGIRYTDVNPDDTMKLLYFPDTLEVSKQLDIDGNGSADFTLKYSECSPYMMGGSCSGLNIIPLNGNSVCVSASHNDWARAFTLNDTIGENCSWSHNELIMFSKSSFSDGMGGYITVTMGGFYKTEEQYAGLKIIEGDHTYYAWLAMKQKVITQYAVTGAFSE